MPSGRVDKSARWASDGTLPVVMEFNVGMPVLLPDRAPSLIGAYEFCRWLFADSSGNTGYH